MEIIYDILIVILFISIMWPLIALIKLNNKEWKKLKNK